MYGICIWVMFSFSDKIQKRYLIDVGFVFWCFVWPDSDQRKTEIAHTWSDSVNENPKIRFIHRVNQSQNPGSEFGISGRILVND